METIAAIATPVGEGAIGIVRLSGPEAVAIAGRVFRGRRSLDSVASHTLHLGELVDEGGVAFDEALVAVMRAPRSYTGEDTVELYCHGGMALLDRLLQRLLQVGARAAEPGEFTKRAFLNGRIDLAQAEAVIDLVRARSPKGLELAASQLKGRLSERIRAEREELLALLAHVQAVIDYPEEGLVELETEELKQRVTAVLGRIDQLLATAEAGRMYQDGIRLGIVGRPNVGKSSLMNAFLQEERAIVTDVAGTTRDVIEARALLAGIPFTLFDTAGLRESTDPVERIGVQRSEAVIDTVDLILLVLDGSVPLSREDREAFAIAARDGGTERLLVALNKSDLPARVSPAELRELLGDLPVVRVSAKSGAGLEALAKAAAELVAQAPPIASDAVVVTRARHKKALEEARRSLVRARQSLMHDLPAELIGVDLQEALALLGEVTGESVSEAVIERIFAEFCVGK